MSAPTVACAIADAMGPLLKAMTEALGANVGINWFPETDRCHAFWSVNIHNHGRCFTGSDDFSPSAALLKANGERQKWEQDNYCPGYCAQGEEHFGACVTTPALEAA